MISIPRKLELKHAYLEQDLQAKKADYLFDKLDIVYLRLLDFRRAPIGRFSAFIVMLYKLITLRPRSPDCL